jgi:AraC family transcriptional activator of mtrCDE
MSNRPKAQLSRPDIEILMMTMEVEVVLLAECLVENGWRLSFPALKMPAIHYNLGGVGELIVGGSHRIPLAPHTLVITPPGQSFQIDAAPIKRPSAKRNHVETQWSPNHNLAPVHRFVAGTGVPEVMLICGYFRASYGKSIDIFESLTMPIVELFKAGDDLEHRLKAALMEIEAQEIGAGAMTTTLLKQVLITLFRRSLSSTELWLERFATLSDHQVARALASMVARPGGAHTVASLAETAGLSRSVFMSRFTSAFGNPSMVVLRDLRMRRAANLLKADILSVEQISRSVGYSSRASFFRAFRDAYGQDPNGFRKTAGPKQILNSW